METRRPHIRFALPFAILATLAATRASARDLSFGERVEYQRAIEEVYWRHRIWPHENPTPKPALAAVMRDAALRARVEDYLKQSNALEKLWQRPLTGEQLQAEMDRMARDTRDGATLGELFHALGDDPSVIAETLARQRLADRLIHNWYASDGRFHGERKAEAEAALGVCGRVDCMKAMGGEYHETTWRLTSEEPDAPSLRPDDHAVALDAAQWQDERSGLARRFGAESSSLPLSQLSALDETPEAFLVTAVLAESETEFTTATVSWAKTPFDAWWNEERGTLAARVSVPPGPFAAPVVDPAPCAVDTWKPTYAAVADPRFRHSAVWTGTEMIVFGGLYLDIGLPINTGGRYDPSTDTWTATTMMNAPVQRDGHSAVWTGTEMIVWGGGSAGKTGGRYDPQTDTWTATPTSSSPSARWDHTAVWTGTEMIVWGGSENYAGDSPLNTGGRYDPSANTWTATSTGPGTPAARHDHTAVWTGTEMIVWGGTEGNDSPFDTGGRYDPSTDTWTATSSGPSTPVARHAHTAVWTGTGMVVWGGAGANDSVLNTGGRYDPATDAWSATSTGVNVPSARQGHTAVWTGTEMIVWGGFDGPSFFNNVRHYDPSTDTWSAKLTGANVPTARRDHSAVWTGTEMIVWGGTSDDEFGLNSGGRYDPSSGSWVATSIGSNVPAARVEHTAAWTGTEMIVWGGTATDPDDGFNSGGRYDPATDSWAATSTGANVPTPRVWHTAVWTGTEMIVWGGFGAGTGQTGGRYDPTTDVWAVTSTGANVPASRVFHTAVWTGTEMIVWGGYSGGYINTGGRYDPATDAWTATSTGANVPAGRSNHSAVWTGTELIVWGGEGAGGGYLKSGGRYHPSTDMWTATSTGANCPSSRMQHSAVWTGTEMIVWGGEGASVTGGRYDPSTDTWTATSTDKVPLGRQGHTAVWTGTEMIAWGGRFGSYPTNTGGRYDPSTDTWTVTSTGVNVPPPRQKHKAVWTGTQMIVWGGSPVTATGGVYCAGACVMGTVPESVFLLNVEKLGAEILLVWEFTSGASAYDVLRGNVGAWPVGSSPETKTCLEDAIKDNFVSDGTVPAPGSGFWYLVRAQNACGGGTWGWQASGGVPTLERISATCP